MTTPRRSATGVATNPGDDGIPDISEDLKRDIPRRIRQKLEAEYQCRGVKPRRPVVYVRRRRSHLERMIEMPIDTLYEIFRQLDPLDLLYLSWASKSLRYIVMDKSARYIWEEAYERIYESDNPPPRCPEDVNFAQYTRFLYYKKCMLCDIRYGPNISWMMRLRICSHCLEKSKQFVIASTSDPFFNTKRGDWSLVVYTEHKNVFVLASDVDSAGKQLQWSEQEERFRLMKGTKEFYVWEIDDFSDRRIAKRRAAIFKKLKKIGWDESSIREINNGQLPDYLTWFDSAKKLTKKEWKNNIRPRIELELSETKQHHLDELFWKRWNRFETKFKEWDQIQTLDFSHRPHATDLLALEPFRTIIIASDTEEADIKIDDIDRVAKEWVEWRDNFLFSLLPQDLQDRYRANKPSLQPLLIFRFTNTRLNNYTLDHVLVRRRRPLPLYLSSEMFLRARICPWLQANQDLRFNTEGFEHVVSILEFLGMDPYTTTIADMAECKQKYKCSICSYGPTVNVEGMIQHDWGHNWYTAPQNLPPLGTRWIRLEDEEISSSHSS